MDINKNFFLHHLRHLEERIESKRSELIDRASFDGIAIGAISSVAADLLSLQAEQRTVCWTLSNVGYYVVYENNHVKDIVPITDE